MGQLLPFEKTLVGSRFLSTELILAVTTALASQSLQVSAGSLMGEELRSALGHFVSHFQ
jgi:hypothetical protein